MKVAKPEWGSKRTCPECATRFYDLGKDEPVTCISCGHAWAPEPLLKSRQHDARAHKPRRKPVREVKDTDAENPDSAAAGAEIETDAGGESETDLHGPDGKKDEIPLPDTNEDNDDPDPAPVGESKIDSKKG